MSKKLQRFLKRYFQQLTKAYLSSHPERIEPLGKCGMKPNKRKKRIKSERKRST
jgi:hypothetical protein